MPKTACISGETGIPYILIRSKRKTISIRISGAGEVEVRAPIRASKQAIEGFLEEKRNWIAFHRKKQQDRHTEKQQSLEKYPSCLPFLGRQYPVLAGNSSFSQNAFYLPRKPLEDLLPAIETLYREQAYAYLPQRVEYWAYKTGLYPEKLSVGSAKGSWGSCSGKNAIRFSCWLMAAPPEAIDAVIVHELCHIREHNHSSRFWVLVKTYIPDYKGQKETLQDTLRNLEAAGLR